MGAGPAAPAEPGAASALTRAAAAAPVVAVAFSGGRDSLALLHVTCRVAAAFGLRVLALHVHHGLMPEADDWLRGAQRLCARWRRRGWPVALRVTHLEGAPAPGDSIEAWARQGRHAALSRMALDEGASLLLLAQHRRDQAETVLLQALRGGGPAGLSAMPVVADRGGLRWARPWLNQPREAIEAYVRRHRLQPVEDPSNGDSRLARSRLRQQVWPALVAAFGDAEAALATAALRAQESAGALAELAAIDLAPLIDAEGRLIVAGWRQLSPARQANALRAWWAGQAGVGPPQALVARLLAEVGRKPSGQWPAGGGWTCHLYRGRLQALHVAAAPSPTASPSDPGGTLDLSHPGYWPVPGWTGVFEVRAADPGQDAAALPTEALRLIQARPRAGGERFQARRGGLPRSLKKQYQSAGVPAHQRAGPLLWTPRGDLLFVPGLGVDARQCPAAGQPALVLCWCPDGAPSGSNKPAG